MGNYRIVIEAVGSHGQDRTKKDGETVDFDQGSTSDNLNPEAIAKKCVEDLKARGENITAAYVHHWPGSSTDVVDNLVTGKRKGNF